MAGGYEAGHQAAEHQQQAAAQWDQLVASYRAQLAADQQAKIDALLLDIIDALARLLTSHDNGEPDPCRRRLTSPPTRQNIHIKRCQTMCRQRGRDTDVPAEQRLDRTSGPEDEIFERAISPCSL